MGSVGSSNSLYDLVVDRGSYIYSSEYQQASKDTQKYFNERNKLREQIRQLQDALDKEVMIDPDLGRQYSKILELYTDRGKEINKELKSLYKQSEDIEKKWTNAAETVARLDSENRAKQLNDWKFANWTMAPAKSEYKGFELDTHTPYLQEYLRKGQAVIMEMSPREYLQRVAYDIFDRSTIESTVRGTIPANVKKYAKMMKQGTKFYMPSLNYRDKQQEGRHRALAALLNGYKTIPVLIVPKR